jgi:prepilin-type N-terminal cleavage/methylation domain-containing protein
MTASARPRSRTGEAGFSLVETVVALGVFSLVLSFLYASVWSGQRQLARVQHSGEGAIDLLAARRVIEQLIESATVTRPLRENAVPIFVGSGQALRFDALLDSGVSPPGLYRISLSVTPPAASDPRYGLVLRRAPLGADAQDEAQARQAVLLTSADKPAFVYRTAVREGRRVVHIWADDWADQTRLPPAVGLRIGQELVLIASPRLDLDPRCVVLAGDPGLLSADCMLR